MKHYDCEEAPGRPGDFIAHAPAVLRPGDPVILYARVSTRRQERAGHLGRQVAHLRRYAARARLAVIAEVRAVSPGWHHRRLRRARYLARRHGATILAHTTDRLIRHRRWWPAQVAVPSQHDLYCMTMPLPADVRLATVVHPDAPASEIRSAHTLRGQALSGRKGGRPRNATAGAKKRAREEKLPRARELRDQGLGVREIARLLRLPVMTVSDWLRRCTDLPPADAEHRCPKPNESGTNERPFDPGTAHETDCLIHRPDPDPTTERDMNKTQHPSHTTHHGDQPMPPDRTPQSAPSAHTELTGLPDADLRTLTDTTPAPRPPQTMINGGLSAEELTALTGGAGHCPMCHTIHPGSPGSAMCAGLPPR